MLVFFVKQVLNLKQAILGRREPHQLAWGVALGLLLGLVPHGNLLALLVLFAILSLAVNHGMAAVAAVAMSYFAVRLDPQSHAVGNYLLTHPDLASYWAAAWQWPFVPWTDINNTVVLGSFVIGVAALIPTYLVTYPLFHYLAPLDSDLPLEEPAASNGDKPQTARVQTAHSLAAPHFAAKQTEPQPREPQTATPAAGSPGAPAPAAPAPASHAPASREVRLGVANTQAVDAALRDVAAVPQWPDPNQRLVNTRIEVVRMVPAGSSTPAVRKPESSTATTPAPHALEQAALESSQQDPPMSEALNYLLRQLRDSQHGRAA